MENKPSFLYGKCILIISPQRWGNMYLSKHHYSLELAKRGNKVFFLSPLKTHADNRGGIRIEAISQHGNLFLIKHNFRFPHKIKFHWKSLYDKLVESHLNHIIKSIGVKIDIVWSFDIGDYFPLSIFPGDVLRIFHPVDEPLNATAINAGSGAQVIFSVTKEILNKYKMFKKPSFLINHGLPEVFLNLAISDRKSHRIIVGLSGNFTRRDIDRKVLLQIIRENPEVNFRFWGSVDAHAHDNNLAGDLDDETFHFLQHLKAQPNVVLYGPVSTADLAKYYTDVDAFLICYDVQKDQSKGTNYHKIIEYLSTGKVIISNNVTAYADQPNLVQMVANRNNNDDLVKLFKKIIKNLDYYNNKTFFQLRREFARDNSYKSQIERIEKIISECAV